MSISEEQNIIQEKLQLTFLAAIKPFETWVMITRSADIIHHVNNNSGEYFQIELDGLALDGWGDLFLCSIHLPIDGHEQERVKQIPFTYAKGSLHLIKSENYSIEDFEVRFFIRESEPVPDELAMELRRWFESHAKSDGTKKRCTDEFFQMLE